MKTLIALTTILSNLAHAASCDLSLPPKVIGIKDVLFDKESRAFKNLNKAEKKLLKMKMKIERYEDASIHEINGETYVLHNGWLYKFKMDERTKISSWAGIAIGVVGAATIAVLFTPAGPVAIAGGLAEMAMISGLSDDFWDVDRNYAQVYRGRPVVAEYTLEQARALKCEKLSTCIVNSGSADEIDELYRIQTRLGCE